jgi:uncharacterized protein (TIGR00369 family)
VLSAQIPNPQFSRDGRTSMRWVAAVMLLRFQGLLFVAFVAASVFSGTVGNLEGYPVVGRVAALSMVLLALGAGGGLALGLSRWGQSPLVAAYEGLLVLGFLAYAVIDRPAAGQTAVLGDPASWTYLVVLPVAVTVLTLWPLIRARLPGGSPIEEQAAGPVSYLEPEPPRPAEIYVPPPVDPAALPQVRGAGGVSISTIERAAPTTVTPPMPAPESPPATAAGWLLQEEPPEVEASLEWLKLPGLDRIRAGLAGGFPPPSFGRLTGLRVVSAEPGEVRAEMPVTGWLRTSTGLLSGGVMAFMADFPMGGAVFTELGPGQVITTSEMSMNFLRPVRPESRRLEAEAAVVQVGRSFAFSEVRISDGDGRQVAHGTARNLIIDVPLPEGPFVPLAPQVVPEGFVDPYLRPVVGEILAPSAWEEMSGLEMVQKSMSGELPNSPLMELFGVRRTQVAEGRVSIVAPCSRWIESPARRLYGGAIALLADAGLTLAVQTTVPAGTAIAPLDLKLQFLRPVRANGQDLTVTSTVTHRGRTLAVATAEVLMPGGKVAALATSSWLIVPDFSWATDRWVSTDEVAVTEDDPVVDPPQ